MTPVTLTLHHGDVQATFVKPMTELEALAAVAAEMRRVAAALPEDSPTRLQLIAGAALAAPSSSVERGAQASSRHAGAIQPVDEERRPFFTPKTLAAYLQISERTVREMVARRTIASYRISGQRRISAEDVDAYLDRHRDERHGGGS